MAVDRRSSPPMAAKDAGCLSKVSAAFQDLRKKMSSQANRDAAADVVPAPQVQTQDFQHRRQRVARNQNADDDTTMLHAMAVDAEIHVVYVEPAMPAEPIRIRDAQVLESIIRFKHMLFPHQSSDSANTEKATVKGVASKDPSTSGTDEASQEASSENEIDLATEHVEDASESTDTTPDRASLEPVDENKIPVVSELVELESSSTSTDASNVPASPKPSNEDGDDKIEPVAEADSIESTGPQNTPVLTPSPSLIPSTITPSVSDQAIARLREPQTVQ